MTVDVTRYVFVNVEITAVPETSRVQRTILGSGFPAPSLPYTLRVYPVMEGVVAPVWYV
jgi:hypothetical protein